MERITSAHDYIARRLGVPTHVRDYRREVAGTSTLVVPANPRRVALVVVNLGDSDLLLGLYPAFSSSEAIRLSANGGTMTMNVDDDFAFVTHDLHGRSATGMLTIVYVAETAIL